MNASEGVAPLYVERARGTDHAAGIAIHVARVITAVGQIVDPGEDVEALGVGLLPVHLRVPGSEARNLSVVCSSSFLDGVIQIRKLPALMGGRQIEAPRTYLVACADGIGTWRI